MTLIDRGEDFGQLDDLTRKRSWMIGLSLPGLEALRSEPGLCEFVEEVGVRNVGAAVYPKGLRRMVLANPPGAGNTYTVDRNHIVARMARFLSERYGGAGLTQLYRTRVCFVDVEAKRILIRHLETGRDLCLRRGCLGDGVPAAQQEGRPRTVGEYQTWCARGAYTGVVAWTVSANLEAMCCWWRVP